MSGKLIPGILILFILNLVLAATAYAQKGSAEDLCTKLCCCCCNYDPTPAGVGISHLHSKGEWMISYSYMNMHMKEMVQGTDRIEKNDVFLNYLMFPEEMRMQMHMLMGMYGISNKFTAMLMFNYHSIEMSMSMLEGDGQSHAGHSSNSGNHEMNTSGMGDMQAWLLYGLMERKYSLMMLSAGASFPTGSIEQKGTASDHMYPGQRYPYAMQTGSGTVDLLPGITYLYQNNKVTASSQLLFHFPVNYNSLGYRKGSEMNFNSWFAYRWHTFLSSSVRLQFVTNHRIDGNDSQLYAFLEPSANNRNYGGENLNVFAGTQFNLRRGVWRHSRIGIEYGLPVYQNLNGIQMQTKQLINLSLSVAF